MVRRRSYRCIHCTLIAAALAACAAITAAQPMPELDLGEAMSATVEVFRAFFEAAHPGWSNRLVDLRTLELLEGTLGAGDAAAGVGAPTRGSAPERRSARPLARAQRAGAGSSAALVP